MPTIYDTRNQQDQEPIEIAWKELVDHKGFELAWRVVEFRLAQEAEQDVGYVPKWIGGPGPTPGFVQRLCERRYEENPTQNLVLARPEFHQKLVSDLEEPHVFKWIDALFQTWRDQCTNGRETPEFLWAIFYKGVADEISKREALLSSGSLFVQAGKYLESVRDRVELEAHKLRQVGQDQPLARIKEKGRRATTYDSIRDTIAKLKRDHPEISGNIRALCAKLDGKNIPLPPESQWERKSKQRTWIGNYDYRDTQPAVQRYVSEVKPASPRRNRPS